MKITFVLKILPVLVFFTKSPPGGRGGRANWFMVRIHEVYRKDGGLLAHELSHVKQWYEISAIGLVFGVVAMSLLDMTLWWTPIFLGQYSACYLIPYFRYRMELEAYAKQLGTYLDLTNTKQLSTYLDRTYSAYRTRLDLFTLWLTTRYGLKVSSFRARMDLSKSVSGL